MVLTAHNQHEVNWEATQSSNISIHLIWNPQIVGKYSVRIINILWLDYLDEKKCVLLLVLLTVITFINSYCNQACPWIHCVIIKQIWKF